MALETRLDVKLNGLAEVQAQNTQLLDSLVKRMGQLESIAHSVASIDATLKRAAQVNGPPEYTPSRTPSRLPGQGHKSKPGRGFGGGGGGSSNFEA